MDCMKTQEMITLFINDKLEINEVIAFFDHIKGCDACFEELEVYYTLLTAMQQMDEDEDVAGNYKEELLKKIQHWEDKIRRQKVQRVRRRFVFLFLVICVGMFMGIEIGNKIVAEIEEKKVPKTEPVFIIAYSGVPEVKDGVRNFVMAYDAEAREYVERKAYIRKVMYNMWYQNFKENRKRYIVFEKGE